MLLALAVCLINLSCIEIPLFIYRATLRRFVQCWRKICIVEKNENKGKTKFITVIIPTFNESKNIKNTILTLITNAKVSPKNVTAIYSYLYNGTLKWYCLIFFTVSQSFENSCS